MFEVIYSFVLSYVIITSASPYNLSFKVGAGNETFQQHNSCDCKQAPLCRLYVNISIYPDQLLCLLLSYM